tara:strand:- start:109 stop:423 length:315 start_codon:yes stop_codon:yes gene_type:complete
MKHRSLLVLAVVAITQVVASTAQANDLSVTCFVNTRTMPCTVSTDPYTLNVMWKDGSTTRYRLNNETGTFVGPKNGMWNVAHDESRGLFLQHQNGNAVGFMKKN